MNNEYRRFYRDIETGFANDTAKSYNTKNSKIYKLTSTGRIVMFVDLLLIPLTLYTIGMLQILPILTSAIFVLGGYNGIKYFNKLLTALYSSYQLCCCIMLVYSSFNFYNKLMLLYLTGLIAEVWCLQHTIKFYTYIDRLPPEKLQRLQEGYTKKKLWSIGNNSIFN